MKGLIIPLNTAVRQRNIEMNSVLLLHGGALNKEMWVHQVKKLSAHFDLHLMDLPGHGKNIDVTFTIESAIKEVSRYIESNIEGETIVVGMSLGGYVAMSYAQENPDKVSKLILSGCCIQYFGAIGLLAKANVYLLKCIGRKYFESMQKRQLLRVASASAVKCILENGISLSGAGDSMQALIGKDFTTVISDCNMPILLVNGEFDRLNRKYEHRYVDVCDDLTVTTINDSGHLCNLEQPDAFSSTVVRFAFR